MLFFNLILSNYNFYTIFYLEFNLFNNMLSILTFRKANASCVLDKPHINHHYEALTHDLPGQIYNTSEQCRQIYGTSFCLVRNFVFMEQTILQTATSIARYLNVCNILEILRVFNIIQKTCTCLENI